MAYRGYRGGSKRGGSATYRVTRATLAVLFLPWGYAKKAFDKGFLTPPGYPPHFDPPYHYSSRTWPGTEHDVLSLHLTLALTLAAIVPHFLINIIFINIFYNINVYLC